MVIETETQEASTLGAHDVSAPADVTAAGAIRAQPNTNWLMNIIHIAPVLVVSILLLASSSSSTSDSTSRNGNVG